MADYKSQRISYERPVFRVFTLCVGINSAVLSQIIIRALIKRRANSRLRIPLHRISSFAGRSAREDLANERIR